MKITTSKSKNSESFYITKSYINDRGVSTSTTVRKLGTLAELLNKHGPTREDVMKWARQVAKEETLKYKNEIENESVLINFKANKLLNYDQQCFYRGGYLFLQYIYYSLHLDKTCRKLAHKYKFQYDINSILSDLVYARVLEPKSKLSSYNTAQAFLEPPNYDIHDVYRALDVIGKECDLIQSEVYKNSNFIKGRNAKILYYDCTNYYFEIEQEDGMKKYGKSKEHRPNPIIQMGLFMDGDGLPLAFSLFDGNSNEQTSLKPLEEKITHEFGLEKFIYCSDAGLGAENIRYFNHIGERAFIVTQSIKKLPKEDKTWALSKNGFKRVSDNEKVDISQIPVDDKGLYYKEEPYTTKKLHQRLIITYSPKYALYQKTLREQQVERAKKMISNNSVKKQRKNLNDPARFVANIAVTPDGEKADIKYHLDTSRIDDESQYDGLYAICTDLLDDDVNSILKVSEGRWQIEECFRIMKTDFSARPVYLRDETRIKAHFLICFLALLEYRILEKQLNNQYTCEEILSTLRNMNFAAIQEQGFMPLYSRNALTDLLHEKCGFRTDYEFITKRKMKNIQKSSKLR